MSKYHPLFTIIFFCWVATAQAQGTDEQLFWQAVDCSAEQEVTLYLEIWPQGSYMNEAHICLGKLAQEAQAQRKAQEAEAKRKAQEAEAQRKAQEAEAQRKADEKWVGKMVAIPAGSFRMGDLNGDGQDDEKPVHTVRLSAFEIGAHEVTVGQFRAFVEDSGYDAGNKCLTYEDEKVENRLGRSWRSPGFGQSATHPVVCVSHDDAQAFINWLNEKTGGNYRLPTEAEWEYAARAGTKSKYSWGDSESQAGAYAWYGANSGGRTHEVGGKRANPWGLYDMHGNVWEWVGDWFDSDYYGSSPLANPQGPDSGRYRVSRGGSWFHAARSLRSANRFSVSPSYRIGDLGFRLVRQP